MSPSGGLKTAGLYLDGRVHGPYRPSFSSNMYRKPVDVEMQKSKGKGTNVEEVRLVARFLGWSVRFNIHLHLHRRHLHPIHQIRKASVFDSDGILFSMRHE